MVLFSVKREKRRYDGAEFKEMDFRSFGGSMDADITVCKCGFADRTQ